MGMRKYYRGIAKARLKAMGVGNVNKKMRGRVRMTHGQVRKMLRTKLGRKKIAALAKAGVANWRRVLWGDLATEGYMMQCHPEELKRKKRRGLVKPGSIKEINATMKGAK